MFKNKSGLYIFARIVPVVQWIELLIPVQLMGVRIPSGTPHRSENLLKIFLRFFSLLHILSAVFAFISDPLIFITRHSFIDQ